MLTGSFAPAEVTLLLTDLSAHALEQPTASREAAMQAGRLYAETLPIEFAPSPAYVALFDRLLTEQAAPVALAVGLVTEQVLAERGPGAVLVSLARAGTPVGVLMRRWALRRHALALQHYSISIVRGAGIDTVALDHLTGRHPARDLVFVDGWTGKGAITRELVAALDRYAREGGARLCPDLAVLADPGACASTYGTRDDLLVPSACLNATVCGLISRTVLRPDLTGPGEFHGAKVYRDLAPADRTADFVDGISAQYDAVASDVAASWPVLAAGDRALRFTGADVVDRLRAEFDLPSAHLVKPGVGETTRVLLRRLPWLVLVRPDTRPSLRHVEQLAAERDVPVVERHDLGGYSCVGIVRPIASG